MQLKEAFFDTRHTSDGEIKKLAANIEQQDSIFKFLPDFVKKNGIPKWEKVIYATREKSNLKKGRSPEPSVKQSTLEQKENPGIFLIPLQAQNEDEVKAYITAYKHNDSLYTYRLYNKDSLNALKVTSSQSKNNLLNAMAVFGYFEKAINNVDSVTIKAPFNGAIKGVDIKLADAPQQKQKAKRNPTPLSQPYIGPDGCIGIINIQISITSVIIYDPPYTFTTIDWYTIQLYIGIYCNLNSTGDNSGDPYSGGSSGTSNWWNYGSGWPTYTASYDPNWYGWWNTGLGSGGGEGGMLFPLIPVELIPDPSIIGDFNDDPNIFEDDPIPITFDYDQKSWPEINSVLSPSQFVPYDFRNCLSLATDQISKAGLRDLGYGSAFKVQDANGGPYPDVAKQGINYIISKLEAGKPVIVGVDNRPGSPSSKNADGKTDHFVTIVGSGSDSNGNFLYFYDNATNIESKGTNSLNRLYYDETTGVISGKSAAPYANAYGDYIVTQIRKNN